jgi:hypothetical protein
MDKKKWVPAEIIDLQFKSTEAVICHGTIPDGDRCDWDHTMYYS